MTMKQPRPRPDCRFLFLALAMLVCLPLALTTQAAAAIENQTGEQIYQQQCLSCHGKHGEGSKEYGHPLAGDRSVGQLAKYIAKSMPDDDPGSCVGEDAEKVAAYIYDAFYSKTAQARNKPARIELSRLTVRQYHNTVADLIGSFRGPTVWEGPKGLHGEYSKSQRFRNKNDRIIDRVDPIVKFDFGVNLPDDAKTVGHRFAIRWEGSILAPETGDYEFVVRTEHSARLWVNDDKKPLIDRWVKSGNDTEYRESIHLLGGRVYPIRLEFSKGKQGSKDGKKDPDPPPTKATIALLWKPPGQTVDVIPQRYLSPGKSPQVLVLQTAFPADDRSVGYERGTSVSKAWDQATTDAAIEVAEYVTTNLGELAGAGNNAGDREKKVREFCQQVRRAGVSPAAVGRAESRSTSTASSRPPRPRKPQPGAWSCWSSSRRGSCTTSSGAGWTPTTSPAGSRTGSGIPCPTRRCSTPRPPASWPRATRSPRRPSGWSTTCGRAPRSASSCSSG